MAYLPIEILLSINKYMRCEVLEECPLRNILESADFVFFVYDASGENNRMYECPDAGPYDIRFMLHVITLFVSDQVKSLLGVLLFYHIN